MNDKMCKCGHYESDHGDDGSCESSASTGYCPCFVFDDPDTISPDPRDAEIAALKAEVERLKRALAAGPAALRDITDDYDGAAEIVEAAQAAALKEGT